jgi:hypothetical protein
MTITFAKSKGDQTGEKEGEKHVYGNPLNPQICPILSMAVWVFTRTFVQLNEDSLRLFDGHTPNKRFEKMFERILRMIEPGSVLFSIIKELGPHSERKGSGTFVLSLSTAISAIAVFLRAGWSVGNVQDRYIFMGAGSDQLVGRAVSGLPINSIEFGTLPPHFKRDENEFLKETIKWANILPGYDNLPAGFKECIPYFLASIVYHHEFLEMKLDKNHPLFKTTVYARRFIVDTNTPTTLIQYLSGKVVTGVMSCPHTQMIATGVPPHLSLLAGMAKLEAAIDKMSTELSAKLNAIPDEVKRTIMDNFVVEGVTPFTREDFLAFSQTLRDEVRAIIGQNNTTTGSVVPDNGGGAANGSRPAASDWGMWTYANKIHFCPPNWEFPTTTMQTMWNLWFFGDQTANIRPYRWIKRYSVKKQSRYDEAKKCIDKMITLANERGFRSNFQTWDEALVIFNAVYDQLLTLAYGEKVPSRPNQIAYTTIGRNLKADS